MQITQIHFVCLVINLVILQQSNLNLSKIDKPSWELKCETFNTYFKENFENFVHEVTDQAALGSDILYKLDT